MNIVRLRPLALVAAAALFAFTACETTTLQTSWKAPEVGSIKFTKVLVIGIAPVDSMRRPLEVAIREQITAVPTVASYELLPDVKDQVDQKKLLEAATAQGVDGIVVLRMKGLEDQLTYNPGGYVPTGYQSFNTFYSPGYALAPYYRGMGPYGGPYGPGYGMGYGMGYSDYVYEPPSITKDTLMTIETTIYDAKTSKLIWIGITTTKNPDDRHNTIPEIAAVVKAKLREQKLIP